MKGFKKLALVAAISAAPFAQAELTSIDDAALSGMTGQAGISIDLSAQVKIGSIEYTDTDGYTGLDTSAGTLGINTIVLGGDGGGALDGIKIDIDVDKDAGLVIHLGATNTADVLSGGADRVDFGLSVGDVTLNNQVTLASGISIGGNLGPIDVVIDNNGKIAVDAYFEVTSGSLDIDVLGLGVTNLTIGDDNSPILDAGNTYGVKLTGIQDQALLDNATLISDAGDQAEADYLAANSAATAGELQAANDAGVAGATAQVKNGAMGGVNNMAYVSMTIQAQSTGYLDTDSFATVEVANALNITIAKMSMDIGMNLSMGETVTRDGGGVVTALTPRSLGSVAINDLDLSGTSLTIYGH